MARFECTCGNVLSNSLCPNDVELHVFTDAEWDTIIAEGKIDNTLMIPSPKHDVWRCPKCLRIYFFKDNMVVLRYVIESDNRN